MNAVSKIDLKQECNTWLSIAGIQELDAVDYETVKQTYNTAFQCARKSDNGRLQVLIKFLKHLSNV